MKRNNIMTTNVFRFFDINILFKVNIFLRIYISQFQTVAQVDSESCWFPKNYSLRFFPLSTLRDVSAS